MDLDPKMNLGVSESGEAVRQTALFRSISLLFTDPLQEINLEVSTFSTVTQIFLTVCMSECFSALIQPADQTEDNSTCTY